MSPAYSMTRVCIAAVVLTLRLAAQPASSLTSHVNPFIGTGGHGHTWPGAGWPFGMVQLSPDTRVEGWDACAGYHDSDNAILGFSHTHLSGTGVPDYGDILLMPLAGDKIQWFRNKRLDRKAVAARFSHENESASPGYYSVTLQNKIRAELTVTPRTGAHRYSYPRGQRPAVFIDLAHGLGPDVVKEAAFMLTSPTEVVGRRISSGWAKEQHVYFVIRFSADIVDGFLYRNREYVSRKDSISGTDIAAVLRFDARTDSVLQVAVGISSVSIDNARMNLDREQPRWAFAALRGQADKAWERELGRIRVEGGTPEEMTTFTTALYHTMLTPNLASDVDGRYRGMDGRIHTARGFDMYSVFSLWDTFRAEHPLLTLIDPQRTGDFVASLLARYDESGALPVWELAANETWCMIGYHSVPVIVDAWMKGVRGFDAGRALRAMIASASLDHFGMAAYRRHGFIPGELESESVSKTLEYAYDDWCIARFAAAMKRDREARIFLERSLSWRNVFDPVTGFMRPRMNGGWDTPFDPAMVNHHFTEANSWQYSFFVPHDVQGLMRLMGGRARLLTKLDSLFSTSDKLTGRQQADITGLVGQYAQGNEPSHHVAYLFALAGAPWKTQAMVRHIMATLYTPAPDGLCGNDDCGQMSAWYVMSALGFYPVTPGTTDYVIGSPLFRSATISLPNRKSFVIEAPDNGPQNVHIGSATLNGVPHPTSLLSHEAIVNGGRLTLAMQPAPDTLRSTSEADCPVTSVDLPYAAAPVISAPRRVFQDSVQVSITGAGNISWAIDGDPTMPGAQAYREPFTVNRTCTVSAVVLGSMGEVSHVTTASFLRHVPIGTIALQTRYKPQYTAGGDNALIDGVRGGVDFRTGTWQGYEGDDLIAVVDLGTGTTIDSVSLGCLQDNNSWIFFPTQIQFSFSTDGTQFAQPQSVRIDVDPKAGGALIREARAATPGVHARYVKVFAKNMRTCPAWHKGAGGPAWLFVDELTIHAR